MQNKTIITAIKLGYDLNDTLADTLQELHDEVMSYLYDNCALLETEAHKTCHSVTSPHQVIS
jgi:hypothetical protein